MRTDSWLRFFATATLLGGTALFLRSQRQAEVLRPREGFISFPLRVGRWVGAEVPIPPRTREALGSGDFMERMYTRSVAEPPVDLFLAYISNQKAGNTIHSPQHCLPGSGWMLVKSKRIKLPTPKEGEITVNCYLISKGLQREVVLYWYQSQGRAVANEYASRLYLVVDTIRSGRTDGGIVRLITPLAEEESTESGLRRVARFAWFLTPLLEKYIPR